MFEMKIKKSQFEELINKMSLPYGKDKFVFEKIAPKFLPSNKADDKIFIEWVGKNKNTTVWVRAQQIDGSGFTEPFRVPFVTKELLAKLNYFEKDDTITYTHDEISGVESFACYDNGGEKFVDLPSIVLDNINGMQEGFSGKVDSDGVIVFKDGSKPNMHAVCDSSIFKRLIKNTYSIMGSTQKDDVPNIYHIMFDAEHNLLRTIAGDETDRAHSVFREGVPVTSIEGNGSLHYAQGFQEVMSNVDGEINISAFVDGPLWVVKRDELSLSRFLITPAIYKKD
jgi:hypothetical protein